MFRNEPRIWREPVKNLGILGLEDAGDLATHNATIARDHRNRIFNIAFLEFPHCIHEWAKKMKFGREKMRQSQRNGGPSLERNCKISFD
jgi:hypothetical protein